MTRTVDLADSLTDCRRAPGGSGVGRVLVIDNYDSFVFNLVHYIGEAGCEPIVHRNDSLGVDDVNRLQPDAIVISPGPGRPEDAGISVPLIRAAAGRIPILGVCLGHQALAAAFDVPIIRAPRPVHGKVSVVKHDGRGLFAGLPSPLTVMRYHSLVARREDLPPVLTITATTTDAIVMGLRHRDWPLEGVQFHPESILTEHGRQMIRNFLSPVPRRDQLPR